jgi:RNA polymerase sigma-70 factor (ECF subfamily)
VTGAGLASGDEHNGTLARRIRNGDAAAESELARAFGERVRAVALARTRDPEAAREVAQEVLIAVISGLRSGQLRDADKLPAFIYGTLRNVLNNSFRAGRRRPLTEPIQPEHVVVDPADPLLEAERANLVRRALATLGQADRHIVLMTLVSGLKPGEIARRMGLSDDVVRARKSRALKRIIESVKQLSRS